MQSKVPAGVVMVSLRSTFLPVTWKWALMPTTFTVLWASGRVSPGCMSTGSRASELVTSTLALGNIFWINPFTVSPKSRLVFPSGDTYEVCGALPPSSSRPLALAMVTA